MSSTEFVEHPPNKVPGYTTEYGANTWSLNIGYKLADTAQQHRRTKISNEISDYLQITKIMARNECPLP